MVLGGAGGEKSRRRVGWKQRQEVMVGQSCVLSMIEYVDIYVRSIYQINYPFTYTPLPPPIYPLLHSLSLIHQFLCLPNYFLSYQVKYIFSFLLISFLLSSYIVSYLLLLFSPISVPHTFLFIFFNKFSFSSVFLRFSILY